jgi:hypothetical protein
MAQPIVEPLSGGLVTSRDPSLLQPGELSVAEDVILLPASPSIQKAYGRTGFANLANVSGLAYADFDSEPDRLVAVADGSYYTSPAETGAFTLLVADAGESLDSVNTLNRSVLFSGNLRNVVLLPDGTARRHGLLPVRLAPGAVHTATGGTWPLGSDQLGFFEYWTTELFKDDNEEVESTFSGTPVTVNVTAVTSYVVISRPEVANSEATHWRVYRSLKKTNATDTAFPVGFLIAEIPLTTNSFSDGIVTPTALTLPTVATAPTTSVKPVPAEDFTQTINPWTSPDNVLVDDGSLAVSGSSYYRKGFQPQALFNSELVLSNFGFTNIGEPVTKIQIQVEGSKSISYGSLTAYFTPDNGVTWWGGLAIPLTTSNSTVTVDYYPPAEATPIRKTWKSKPINRDHVWAGAEFADGLFKVLLVSGGGGSFPSEAPASATISLDFVKVAVTHSGATASQTTQFPNLALQVSGERVLIGSNDSPPVATTADVFQGSILMNDVDSPTNIAWTIPGTLDYVPVLYRMALNDTVTCIRALGSSAIIGTKSSCIRMNYLPVAEDPEFNTGRAVDIFDADDGIVGYKAAVPFVLNGVLMLFYVGHTALKITNGFQTESATNDIVWTELVNLDDVASCFVENNTQNHELLVFYPTADGSTRKMLRLSYDSAHVKNGKLKVVGITNYSAVAATSGVPVSEKLIYTAKSGAVYLENRGLLDASGGTIVPRVSGREMHLNGIGGSWELLRYGIHHRGGGGTLTTYSTSSLANYPAESTDPQPLTMDTRTTSIVDNAAAGDGITLNIVGADDGLDMKLDYIVLYPGDLGESTPLKR